MPRSSHTSTGLWLALVSAASFGTSGAFATSLLRSGWSPAAAVTVRLAVAALVLTGPALWQLRGRWTALRGAAPTLLGYGGLAVAGAQLCYFSAVRHLDVGVALMLEYLGTVLVVAWVWLRHGHRPSAITLAGAVVALLGLALVLGLTGSGAPVRLDAVGVAFGLGAAVGLAAYFVISGSVDSGSDERLPPLVLAWAGMVVGAVGLFAVGITGLLPLAASTADVTLASARLPWLVPVLALAVVAAALAYVTGIVAARRLGPRLASFVGLFEVVFAVVVAWLLLGQMPGPLQRAGGAAILAGVALVKLGEGRPAAAVA